MLPLLKIRDDLDFSLKQIEKKIKTHEFVRMNGKVAYYKNKQDNIDVVHGPYKYEKS